MERHLARLKVLLEAVDLIAEPIGGHVHLIERLIEVVLGVNVDQRAQDPLSARRIGVARGGSGLEGLRERIRDSLEESDEGLDETAFARLVELVRYVDGEGRADYYTPDGLNVRKAFMRNPIPIVRVSSASSRTASMR